MKSEKSLTKEEEARLLREYNEVKDYWERRRIVNDKLEAIKNLPPEGLPSSLMIFRSLFECSDKGRVIAPHLAATLGTDTAISYDDFLVGFRKFELAVEAVYKDLLIERKVKLLHDIPLSESVAVINEISFSNSN